MGKNVNKFHLS